MRTHSRPSGAWPCKKTLAKRERTNGVFTGTTRRSRKFANPSTRHSDFARTRDSWKPAILLCGFPFFRVSLSPRCRVSLFPYSSIPAIAGCRVSVSPHCRQYEFPITREFTFPAKHKRETPRSRKKRYARNMISCKRYFTEIDNHVFTFPCKSFFRLSAKSQTMKIYLSDFLFARKAFFMKKQKHEFNKTCIYFSIFA